MITTKANEIKVSETDKTFLIAQELKNREIELESNQNTVNDCVLQLPMMEDNRERGLKELAMQVREANIIMANPLKYAESEAYAEFMKDLMQLKLDGFKTSEEQSNIAYEIKVRDLAKRKADAQERVDFCTKRIKELKKK